MTNEKHFPKTIGQWEFDYGLFTNLPRIILACDFYPSSIFWYIPGSFVAIAADTNSTDTVWFIQIVESSCAGHRVLCDHYGHKIAAGANF